MTRRDKAPHACPGCDETVVGRKYHNDACRARFHNRKRVYKAIKQPRPAQLPLIEQSKRDTRSWDERKVAILAKRDRETKRYG